MKIELIYRIFKKFCSISGISPSFSSDGEDYIISKYFMKFEGGVYIDIGANHPVKHSNTFQLYLTGWSGLCVDPIPIFRRSYKYLRPRDTFVNAGLTSKNHDHRLQFYYYRDYPDNSTFDPRRVEALKAKFGREPSSTQDVKAISVDYLIDGYLKNIKPDLDIQFLNLDTEGLELEIILAFFHKKIFPWMICVEDLGTSIYNLHSSDIHEVMSKNGYEIIAKTFLSSIYFRNEMLPKLPSPFIKELLT